tara:strand:- start:469 stop:675 length:207 start_codon:yes stop_codon:yes gene_type:complete
MAKTTSKSLTNASQNLPRQPFDSVVISRSGVPGGLQDIELEIPTRSEETIKFDNRGIQGISTSGWDVI